MSEQKTCIECGSPVHCSDRCEKHYKAWWYKQPKKPCQCGCGKLTKAIYAPGHHTKFFSSEEQSRRGRMNDGSALRAKGDLTSTYYRKIGGRHEHRVVAEEKYGRPLTFDDVVHHMDGDKRNNDPSNLEIMSRAEHIAVHKKDLMNGRKAKQKQPA